MADNFEPVKFNPEEKKEEKKGVMGSGGQIDLNALKNLDPELSKLCSELDLDGDGTINAAELTRACGVIRETRDESAEWQKAAFRRLIAIVALLAINLVLIGTVTYYIVWSTAAVRVDENGNLVNFHEDGEESAPAPVAAQTAMEEKSALDALFESADYNNIDMLAYTNSNGAQFVRPQGYSVFEKEIEGAAHDVVVVYVDGTTAIVVENKIADPYVIDPSTPYTIYTDVAFGEVNADNLVRPAALRKLSKVGSEKATKKTAKKSNLDEAKAGKVPSQSKKTGAKGKNAATGKGRN